MKKSLRTLAIAATMAGSFAAFAQDAPTVEFKWKHHLDAAASTAIRAGNAFNGEIYFVNGASIYAINGEGTVRTHYTHPSALNMGFTMDEAGNIIITPQWPTGLNTWTVDGEPKADNWLLVKADGTAQPLTLAIPAPFVANRSDMQGRATGDFLSADGGVFYLTTNDATCPYPAPVWVAEGEQVELEQVGPSAGVEWKMTAASTMSYAVPTFESMDDFDPDAAFRTFWYKAYNATDGVIWSINEEETPYFTTKPVLPEDYGFKQNGWEIFNLGDKNYYVLSADNSGNWTSNFVIGDEEGNVIYQSEYGKPGDGWNGNTTGNGGIMVARKVSENKVELYQIYASGVVGTNFGAMYEITLGGAVEEPAPLYITGGFDGWKPATPAEFTYAEGKYTFNLTDVSQGFKISTAKGSWDDFNGGGLTVAEGSLALETGNTYKLAYNSNPGNFMMAPGNYTLTVDLEALTLAITGEADAVPFVAPDLYVRGASFGWESCTEANKFATDGELTDGVCTYTLKVDELSGEFKIANQDWTIGIGGGEITAAGTYTLDRAGGNIKVAEPLKNVTLTLAYPESLTGDVVLTVEVAEDPAPVVERKGYAYELKAVAGENNLYTITYKATAAAKAAELVLTDGEGNETAVELPAPVKGENSAEISLNEIAAGNYTFAIRLTNEAEADAITYSQPAEFDNLIVRSNGNINRGGVVWIRDTNADAFGYTVVGYGESKGYLVYNPEGELLTKEPVHTGEHATNNASSTYKGDANGGLAVFADWSDKYSGYWVLDPLNPTAEMYNMLMPEGAVQAADGTVTYNGVATGSGSPTVAFYGYGEETKMFGHDEDIYKNKPVMYNLGDAKYVTEAPVQVFEVDGVGMNIDFLPLENGLFCAAARANGNDSGKTAGLQWLLNDGERVWDSGNANLFPEGSNSGITLLPDGKTLILGQYNGQGIYVFDLAWNEYDEPTLTYQRTIEIPGALPAGSGVAQYKADAAGNIHMQNGAAGGYKVLTLAGESTATTPAKKGETITVTTGIEGVAVDAAAPVEYYNLNGVRVNADNLTPGVYVRRQGKVATKVVVR